MSASLYCIKGAVQQQQNIIKLRNAVNKLHVVKTNPRHVF